MNTYGAKLGDGNEYESKLGMGNGKGAKLGMKRGCFEFHTELSDQL